MPTKTEGFNVDERVRNRAQQDIVIGGETFHPGRQDWAAIHDLRKAGRLAARADREREKTEAKASKLEQDDKYEEADALYEQADAQFRQALVHTCSTVARQLVGDNGEPPTAEFVFEHVDMNELNALIGHLVGETDDADRDAVDPTS